MLVDTPEFDIRYTAAHDEVPLREWLKDPKILREFPASTPNEVAAFIPNWIGFQRYKSSITAVYKDEAVGIGTLLLMPYQKLIHHCLTYIIVDPAHFGQGIGTVLVRNLKHLAKDYFHFEKVYCEFYSGNRLASILAKQGFHETLHQDNFVKDKDGYRARIIMEAPL